MLIDITKLFLPRKLSKGILKKNSQKKDHFLFNKNLNILGRNQAETSIFCEQSSGEISSNSLNQAFKLLSNGKTFEKVKERKTIICSCFLRPLLKTFSETISLFRGRFFSLFLYKRQQGVFAVDTFLLSSNSSSLFLST